ncbi:PfkB family carbohydrate kinase, partial [Escherichia coli]|uniref:PfkB family carbohydrate kinase n=1 Tax=Escherichia coli TaxID=562 RepID=UPI00200E868C
MKTLATIGDNCVDIYPQLNKAFSGGNAVNVAVYCTRYGIKPGCITWVGDDDYGTKLKQDLARMDVDISHVLKLAGAKKEVINQRVNQVAEVLQLAHLLDRKPKA